MLDFNKIKEDCDLIVNQVVAKEVAEMESEGYKYTFYSDNENPSNGDKVYDICGGASIVIKDMRSSFGREFKKFMKKENEWYSGSNFRLYKSSGRQEMRVNVAVAKKISEYLNLNYNANTFVKEYVC